jgi:hypothetical protein
MHDPPDVLAEILGIGNSSQSSGNSALRILTWFLSTTKPLVIIVSDVAGQDDMQYAISTIIPTHMQSSISMETEYCHAITAKQSQKALERIVSLIACSRQLHDDVKRTSTSLPSSVIEDLAVTSNGDLR